MEENKTITTEDGDEEAKTTDNDNADGDDEETVSVKKSDYDKLQEQLKESTKE